MKILSILAILFGFSQCGSSKLVKNPPFKVEKATYKNWVGGQPGVRGTKVEFHLTKVSEVTFETLYFKNRTTKVETSEKGGKTIIIGHFNTSTRDKNDLILDIDPKKEINNKPPVEEKFPFELKNNEAVVSYKKGTKTYFYKIENLTEAKPTFFPKVNK